MLFKFGQIIVSLLLSLASLFTAQIPQTPVETDLPLVNINPNPIAESVATQDVTVMTFNVKISGDEFSISTPDGSQYLTLSGGQLRFSGTVV